MGSPNSFALAKLAQASLSFFIKQPSDVKDYDVEYQDWLAERDTVLDAEVVLSPGTSVTLDTFYVVHPRVNVWLSGGVHGETCKVTVTTTTSAGRVRQDEFRVKIKEY